MNTIFAIFKWIFAASFMFGGLIFVAFSIYEFRQGMKTEEWPAVSGQITKSETESRSSDSSSTLRSSTRRSSRSTSYSVNVRYSYEVAGEKLEGWRIQHGYQSHNEQASAEQEKSRYAKGTQVQVYYDPTNPSQSCLVKGSGASWIGIGLGLLFLVIGIVVAFVLTRMGRGEPVAGAIGSGARYRQEAVLDVV